jgi:hypothetical protein
MTRTYQEGEEKKEQRDGARAIASDIRVLLSQVHSLLVQRQSQDILPLIEKLPLEEGYRQELGYILGWNYFLEQNYQKVFEILGLLNMNDGSVDHCQHDYHALTEQEVIVLCCLGLGEVASNLGYSEEALMHLTRCAQLLHQCPSLPLVSTHTQLLFARVKRRLFLPSDAHYHVTFVTFISHQYRMRRRAF